ncbi:MAG: hypothetical protein KG003_07910 [Bacteroidetes bacterium]|nr:hypothetical protein [Bacteroidota bacterium]
MKQLSGKMKCTIMADDIILGDTVNKSDLKGKRRLLVSCNADTSLKSSNPVKIQSYTFIGMDKKGQETIIVRGNNFITVQAFLDKCNSPCYYQIILIKAEIQIEQDKVEIVNLENIKGIVK